MRTYQSFQLRKWLRLARCKQCGCQFEAGPSAMYCPPCSKTLLADTNLSRHAETRLPPNDPPSVYRTGHYAMIDYMVRDQHGRSQLASNLLRWAEARL